MRKILVTNALPYANGPIHMGHLLGYIQADIWVRAMRAMGHDVTYVCADDAHGTAIMLRAEANGISPEAQIANVQKEHIRDFDGFGVHFDHYDSTHSDANKARASEIYIKNREAGNIAVRPVTQLFDPEKGMFLSDRFIKGTCPKCKSEDQYGDACEVCGTTYNATELLNPRSTLSGATPVEKSSDHYFFKLPNFSEYLQKWTRDQGRLPVSIANKLDEWFEAGLSDWDISRDAPYFGFEIPDAPNKYFYVWVDAPIGYMSSFENYIKTKRPDLSFDDFWKKDSDKEVYHFIGKDIVYFHALFWPAMLEGANYRTPSGLFVNGFLTVNGQKMSKSRGTFIKAETYLQHLNPEYLRYYFASKLSDKVEDSDLNLDDFVQKVNSDLVGKVVNIANVVQNSLTPISTIRFQAHVQNLNLCKALLMRAIQLLKPMKIVNFLRRSVKSWHLRIRRINILMRKNRGHLLSKKVKNNKFMMFVRLVLTCSVNLRFTWRQSYQRLRLKFKLSYNLKALTLHHVSKS